MSIDFDLDNASSIYGYSFPQNGDSQTNVPTESRISFQQVVTTPHHVPFTRTATPTPNCSGCDSKPKQVFQMRMCGSRASNIDGSIQTDFTWQWGGKEKTGPTVGIHGEAHDNHGNHIRGRITHTGEGTDKDGKKIPASGSATISTGHSTDSRHRSGD